MKAKKSIRPSDPAAQSYRQKRQAHWDSMANQLEAWRGWGGGYHRRLTEVYRFLVPARQRVLEVGCGLGDLLAALDPSEGVGVDFSPEMVRRAASRHPQLRFVNADVHDMGQIEGKFDAIILSDVVNDLWDVQTAFQELARLTDRHTRIILNYHSRLWELPLRLAQRLRLAIPTLEQNWLTVEDVANLLDLAGFEVIRHWPEVSWLFPFLNHFMNRFLTRLWPFNLLALCNFTVARPHPKPSAIPPDPSVSVIIPARNEAGNIPAIFERTPCMGSETELIFVEGHSKDNTYEAIEASIREHPERQVQLMRQKGIGKADAVRLGFEAARGDILMVLDADMTVPPEDLIRFYEAIRMGKGDFINGVRLIYPMEQQAMRWLNLLGNKFFSLAFTWLLGQPIKDTLCGTKVLWNSDYRMIVANRSYFGDFDPFGDFDLLFGAARLSRKIIDMPIRYRERTYGETNIQRWKHGWLLLKMVLFAALRIKFT